MEKDSIINEWMNQSINRSIDQSIKPYWSVTCKDRDSSMVRYCCVCLVTLTMVYMFFWMSSEDVNDRGDGPFAVSAIIEQGLLGQCLCWLLGRTKFPAQLCLCLGEKRLSHQVFLGGEGDPLDQEAWAAQITDLIGSGLGNLRLMIFSIIKIFLIQQPSGKLPLFID